MAVFDCPEPKARGAAVVGSGVLLAAGLLVGEVALEPLVAPVAGIHADGVGATIG